MVSRGTVYFDDNFVFSDGTKGQKLLILLNTPQKDENYILVKTTSKQKNKPASPGCIEGHHKVYYLPSQKDFFNKNTWVQLDDYFLFLTAEANSRFKKTGKLTDKTIDKVVKCFLKINELDLSPKIRKLFISPIANGAAQLAEKFNKRR
ncbi:MAG: hypothetical protein U9O82_00930 [Thermodesulfobacteriota bacterium]|nr:hypothetical protein [Thermodesulfobacteriota bacterium]